MDQKTDERATDIEVLAPDRELRLASGEVVTVRGLPFREALRLQGRPDAAAFFEELGEDSPADEAIAGAILTLAPRHVDWWFAFLASATGLDEERLAGLSVEGGTLVALAAVKANPGFFGVGAVMAARRSASPTSSPSSSATGTGTPST